MNNDLFEYEIDNNCVTILKYIGKEAEVVVPPEIDGYPVTKIGRRAFADCFFITSVVLPDEQMEIAEGAFDNCPNADFFAAEPNNNSKSDNESSPDNNKNASEQFNFNFESLKLKNNSNPGAVYKKSSNRSKLESDDFRQPFSNNHRLYPQMRKGAMADMLGVLLSNLPFILFYSFLILFLDILFSAGVSGLITIVLTEGRSLTYPPGAFISEDLLVFSMTFQIVSLLFLGVFFTGFIRIMYAMALERPYSWKLIFSGFDRSFLGILITWTLLFANMICGLVWFFWGTEIMHFPPALTCTPPFFINLPIAVYLMASLVIKAGKNVWLLEMLSLCTRFISPVKDSLIFFLFSIISFIFAALLAPAFGKDDPLSPAIITVSIATLLCVTTCLYYTVIFTKVCPNALDNDDLETNQNPEPQKSATKPIRIILTSIFCLFTMLGLALTGLYIFGKSHLNKLINSDNVQDINSDNVQDINPDLIPETDLSMFEYKPRKTGVTIEQFDGSVPKVKIPATINRRPVTVIGNGAFSSNSSITYVEFPASVTEIQSGAFQSCRSLKSARIPDGVTAIGDFAFSNCSSLTSVTIPENVNYSPAAFDGCPNLKIHTIKGTKAEENAAGDNSSNIKTSITNENETCVDDNADAVNDLFNNE